MFRNYTVPALLFVLPAAIRVEAAPPVAPQVATSATMGVVLAVVDERVMVSGVSSPGSPFRMGDQIVAVGGRRVTSEAAFLSRLNNVRNSAAAKITIAREGRVQVLNVAVPKTATAAGFLNPSQMVRTSQGIMHRDVAARLGLSGTPLSTAH